MTKPSNLAAIEETTKTSWDDWVAYLESKGARELPHRAIAGLAYDRLKDTLDNAGWWSQSVAVAYEQHSGRRLPGQRSDGTFEAAVSKTVNGSMDDARSIWLRLIDGQTEFDGVAMAAGTQPTMTAPERNRHWAVNLADGSRLSADTYPKSAGKCSLTVTHSKLTSPAEADRWRAYWKSILAAIDT